MHVYVTQWSTSSLKFTQMTLAISTLKKILFLHTKTQDNLLNIPMCYSKCHNVHIFSHVKKLLMLTNGIILVINWCDTFKPLLC